MLDERRRDRGDVESSGDDDEDDLGSFLSEGTMSAIHRRRVPSHDDVEIDESVDEEEEDEVYDRKHVTLSFVPVSKDEMIHLNVGGEIFVTTRDTLTRDPESMLAVLISGSHMVAMNGGQIFLDREPHLFRYILRWLRTCIDGRGGILDVDDNDVHILRQLLVESEYFALDGLKRTIIRRMQQRGNIFAEDIRRILRHEFDLRGALDVGVLKPRDMDVSDPRVQGLSSSTGPMPLSSLPRYQENEVGNSSHDSNSGTKRRMHRKDTSLQGLSHGFGLGKQQINQFQLCQLLGQSIRIFVLCGLDLRDVIFDHVDFSSFSSVCISRCDARGTSFRHVHLGLSDEDVLVWEVEHPASNPSADLSGVANDSRVLSSSPSLGSLVTMTSTSTVLSAHLPGSKNIPGSRDISGTLQNRRRVCDCLLTDSVWTSAQLTGVDFSGSNLKRACFRDAIMDRCRLDRTNVEDIDLIGSSRKFLSMNQAVFSDESR